MVTVDVVAAAVAVVGVVAAHFECSCSLMAYCSTIRASSSCAVLRHSKGSDHLL